MKRLVAGIESQDLQNQIETIKSELIRQFNNLTTALNDFEQENNISFNNDIKPDNNSQNFLNPNADVGIKFENMQSLLTYYFNTYKNNIKNFTESIVEEDENMDGGGNA